MEWIYPRWANAAALGLLGALSLPGDELLSDDLIVRKLIGGEEAGRNLLRDEAWGPSDAGFGIEDGAFACDNGESGEARRGVYQTVLLEQAEPKPIVARAWSKAQGVGGSRDNDYSLYLDLYYSDGTPEWGVTAPFRTGTHDWERREITFIPRKPVHRVNFHLLLRGHPGKAWFRGAELEQVETPAGAAVFDGVPVSASASRAGFLLRDVAAGSGFAGFARGRALGAKIEYRETREGGATFYTGRLQDETGRDRAVTLCFTVPVRGEEVAWLADPRTQTETRPPAEYLAAARFAAGANGHVSRYPLAAVAAGGKGVAIAIDMEHPAFFRAGYSAGTAELYIAYDFGLAPERSHADFRFCVFEFDAEWGFRAALERLYGIFPGHFEKRIRRHGIWMPFHKISEVEGWEDFGFRFKEGNDETEWDDAHGMLTFRYTEPQTWWMPMPKEMPRTMDAALAEARRLADGGDERAKALLASGYHDEEGKYAARLLNTPWTDGAVWSMNSSPAVAGAPTDFTIKWNEGIRERLYGPDRKGDQDGEYIDSAECYVTDDLNFRREHFAASSSPLAFSLDSRRPALFKELTVFDYVRAIAADVHRMGKAMMANSTPDRICWLAPLLDVMGTETDWNPGGSWRPMSGSELLYRRALCGPKPYCFLMNTVFDEFPPELVEKYMKRCLAYGMLPGFFSHNAAEGHYFSRPDLYNRDRPLFKKYVPLCRLVSEAGWRPVTGARCDDPEMHVERFGESYLTVFNAGSARKTVTVRVEGVAGGRVRDLVTGRRLDQQGGRFGISLDPEDVAVVEMGE